MMKVCVFRSSEGACDYYRAVLPTKTMMNHQKIQTKQLWLSSLIQDIVYEREMFMNAMQSDIYLVQRISGSSFIDKMRSFSDECGINAKIIMDFDDDMFNVFPLSAHYVDFGSEEIRISHNGKTVHEWKDSVNINIKANRNRLDEIKRGLGKVDLLTVTTDVLADVYRPYIDNIRVLPNCVNLKEWNRLPLLRENKEEIRIAWAGGHSHFEDLLMIREPLIEIGKKYPNVKILMLGYMPVSMDKYFRSGQLEFLEWVEFAAHPYRLAAMDIDIAVIPLKDNVFNRSKSAIKWIEFSSLSVPSVVSHVTPYKEMDALSEKNKAVFIENNDKDAWFKGMEKLINDEQLRREIGQNAREVIEANFDINTQYHQWLTAYEEVKCQSSLILK